MHDEELDRILSGDEGLVPSSGFTASVMDAVRSKAATPPPIPFPWTRALPIAAAALAVLPFFIIGLVRLIRDGGNVPLSPAQAALLATITNTATSANAGWFAGVLVLTILSLIFTSRLSSRGA